MEKHRIIVIGSNVATVQRVSCCCLAQGADVFPYYGIPTSEEITLFAPELWVLCLPMPKVFWSHIREPYILWSEQHMDVGLTLGLIPTEVSTPAELEARLQKEFIRLK